MTPEQRVDGPPPCNTYKRRTWPGRSLIDAAKPELDARESTHVFVSIGAGDAFTAIRILFELIAFKKIPLPSCLVFLYQNAWCGEPSRVSNRTWRSAMPTQTDRFR